MSTNSIEVEAVLKAIDFLAGYEVDPHGFNDRAIKDLEGYVRELSDSKQDHFSGRMTGVGGYDTMVTRTTTNP